MRMSICILLLAIVMIGPLPPNLLPGRPGPATLRQARQHCTATINRPSWPVVCGPWRMR